MLHRRLELLTCIIPTVAQKQKKMNKVNYQAKNYQTFVNDFF